MDPNPIPNSNELLLGQLIAKADQSLNGIERMESALRELTSHVQSVERELRTTIASVDRELSAKIANNTGRIVILETNDGHKKQNFTLLVALAGLAGSLSSLAKMFGLL